jgi:acetylornithine deacetylase
MSVSEILRQLVGINSVSSRSNLEISEWLLARCESLDLKLKRFPYRDENGIEKQNLIALVGTDFSDSVDVELALVGHTDTVPFDPSWSEALTLTERDGKLYGRGACDTKGFIAAMLAAIEKVDRDTLKRPLVLVFTADEEVGLMGAKRLADLKPMRARYSIVGEPTSLRPMRAGKGYSLAEITLKGREAHSAYPAFGASAIFKAARLLRRIEDMATKLESERHEAFDPPFTTLNVGLVNGGTAKNVIPGECRFTLEWRPIPGQGSARLLGLLDEAISRERAADKEFDCIVNASRSDEGFETSGNSELVQMLELATGNSAGTVAFGTEAAQMIALGAEAVVFGPGDIRVAHRTGEFVPVNELENCVAVLHQAIDQFCR